VRETKALFLGREIKGVSICRFGEARLSLQEESSSSFQFSNYGELVDGEKPVKPRTNIQLVKFKLLFPSYQRLVNTLKEIAPEV